MAAALPGVQSPEPASPKRLPAALVLLSNLAGRRRLRLEIDGGRRAAVAGDESKITGGDRGGRVAAVDVGISQAGWGCCFARAILTKMGTDHAGNFSTHELLEVESGCGSRIGHVPS